MLLQDVWFLEKPAHFDREVIPERICTLKARGPMVHLHRDARRLTNML
ncbi:Catalase [Nitrosomonas sp. Nm33]|nr:Catalase [Nitrosomonas sp. Nm33]